MLSEFIVKCGIAFHWKEMRGERGSQAERQRNFWWFGRKKCVTNAQHCMWIRDRWIFVAVIWCAVHHLMTMKARSSYHLRFVCATIFDDDRFSFRCQTPSSIHCSMFSFVLNWLKASSKKTTHTHTAQLNYEYTHKHTQIYRFLFHSFIE